VWVGSLSEETRPGLREFVLAAPAFFISFEVHRIRSAIHSALLRDMCCTTWRSCQLAPVVWATPCAPDASSIRSERCAGVGSARESCLTEWLSGDRFGYSLALLTLDLPRFCGQNQLRNWASNWTGLR
jgi:hypothetical protein